MLRYILRSRYGDGGELLRGCLDRLGVDIDNAVGELLVKGLTLFVDVAERLFGLHCHTAALELGDASGDGFV